MEKVGIDVQANLDDSNLQSGFKKIEQQGSNLSERMTRRMQEVLKDVTRTVEQLEDIGKGVLQGTRKRNDPGAILSADAAEGMLRSTINKAGISDEPFQPIFERLAKAKSILSGQKADTNPFSFSVLDVEKYGSTELLRANISELQQGKFDPKDKSAFTSVSQDLLSRIRSRYSSGLSQGISALETERERIGTLPLEEQQSALDELATKQERLVKTSIASAKSIQEFSDTLSEFSDTTKKARGGLPSYFMAAAGAVLQAGQSLGQLYHLNQTSFDLNSPQGMVNALYGKEMGTRSILGQGVGTALGGIAGLALAPLTGGTSLLASLGAMYAGSQIGSGIGSTWASVANTGTEVEQKTFNSISSKTLANVAIANQAQTASANLRRFGNQSEAPFLKLDESQIQQAMAQYEFAKIRGGNDIGAFSEARILAGADRIPFAEIAPIAGQYKYTKRDIGIKGFDAIRSRTGMEEAGRESDLVRGILSIQQMASSSFSDPTRIVESMNYLANLPTNLFGNQSEYGKLGEAGLAKITALSGAVTPSSPAQEALLFRALKQQNPNATFTEIQLQMREGIKNPRNLQALLDTGYLRNKQVAQAYLMSSTSLTSDDITRFSEEMGNGTFRIRSGDDVDVFGKSTQSERDAALARGESLRTLGETGAQTIAQSNISAGMDNLKWVTDLNVGWNEFNNTLSTNQKMIELMRTKYDEATTAMRKFMEALEPPTTRSGAAPGRGGWVWDYESTGRISPVEKR